MSIYTIDGETLDGDGIRQLCNAVEFNFGVLRKGLTVYKSRWINAHQADYTVDSEHATEAQAQQRVQEIITRGMVGMTKAELEYIAAVRDLDKWRESENQSKRSSA